MLSKWQPNVVVLWQGHREMIKGHQRVRLRSRHASETIWRTCVRWPLLMFDIVRSMSLNHFEFCFKRPNRRNATGPRPGQPKYSRQRFWSFLPVYAMAPKALPSRNAALAKFDLWILEDSVLNPSRAVEPFRPAIAGLDWFGILWCLRLGSANFWSMCSTEQEISR